MTFNFIENLNVKNTFILNYSLNVLSVCIPKLKFHACLNTSIITGFLGLKAVENFPMS